MKTEKEIADEFIESIQHAIKMIVEQTMDRLLKKMYPSSLYDKFHSGGIVGKDLYPTPPFADEVMVPVAPPVPVNPDTLSGTCVKHIDGRVGEFRFMDEHVADMVWVVWNGEQVTSLVPAQSLHTLPPCKSDDCIDPVEQIAAGIKVDVKIDMATGLTEVTPVIDKDLGDLSPVDKTPYGADIFHGKPFPEQLRYKEALERIMDFHPPGNATHECAKKALSPDGKG